LDILPSATIVAESETLGCYEMPSRRRLRPNSTTRARAKATCKGKHKGRVASVAESLAAKSEKSRKAILKSAAALFRNQGYSATTLRQIASAARIKAGSIYYYFDSKEEIVSEVLERGLQHVFDSVKAAVRRAGNTTHRRRIALAIEAHLVALLESSEFTSANIRIYGQLPERLKRPHRPLRRAYAKYWDRLFLDARRAGEIRADIEIVPLRIFVIGALNWTVEWFNLESREAVLSLARRTELLIFDGLKKS
jgi:AcrR family transcriptional regulator